MLYNLQSNQYDYETGEMIIYPNMKNYLNQLSFGEPPKLPQHINKKIDYVKSLVLFYEFQKQTPPHNS